MMNGYDSTQVQAIALDVWDGSETGVRYFMEQTGITYPICMDASSIGSAYGVSNHYTVVVDQAGIIRYKTFGFDHSAVESVINGLLTTGIREPGEISPKEFRLYPGYPNPFNSTTRLTFDLPRSSSLVMTLFDLKGRVVLRQDLGKFSAGHHSFPFSANNLSSGEYLVEIKAGEQHKIGKLMLLK